MRTMILGCLVVFGLAMGASPASAYDGDRLHRACRHGDRHACHVLHLRRACDHGDRHACRALRRM